MKNVTIFYDETFKSLCSLSGQEPNALNEAILKCLLKYGIIEDGQEDCGMTILELGDLKGLPIVIGVPDVLWPFGYDAYVLFKNLKIVHQKEDCPYCGCETETITEGGFGKVWVDVKCTNLKCDYYENNEPKF